MFLHLTRIKFLVIDRILVLAPLHCREGKTCIQEQSGDAPKDIHSSNFFKLSRFLPVAINTQTTVECQTNRMGEPPTGSFRSVV